MIHSIDGNVPSLIIVGFICLQFTYTVSNFNLFPMNFNVKLQVKTRILMEIHGTIYSNIT